MKKKFMDAKNPFDILPMFDEKYGYWDKLSAVEDFGRVNLEKTYDKLCKEAREASKDGDKTKILELFLCMVFKTFKYLRHGDSDLYMLYASEMRHLGVSIALFGVRGGTPIDPIEYYKLYGLLLDIHDYIGVNPYETHIF